ncbi:Ig-like domain-containing protein [Clostridium tyrobutyricum]|uniref:Ig-like domain-containing protein n=1 Tax=Clostridium tyrobutyricum TaxID=1519 RepID=UPI001C393129|nr:Ig-like domain-containing protein [Clostridium tyrobutyricum]MBV4418256.1 Ig-like domain-containing protein [Clostridium tyrobutyricum]
MNTLLNFYNLALKHMGKTCIVNNDENNMIEGIFKEIDDRDTSKDEKYFITVEDLKQGDIISYNNINYMIITRNENINDVYDLYTIEKCNYNINFAIDNVIFPEVSIITNKSIDLETEQWVILPANKILITVQANSITNNIKVADRFIKFKQAWIVEGVDYTKNGILELQAKQDTIQSGDDLVNEIPTGAATYNPIVSATPNPLNVNINSTSQITATVTVNGTNVENPTLIYTSSNSDICTVDNTGLVTGVVEGNANITISYLGIDGNTYSTIISASVVTLPQHNYTLEVTPYDDSYWDDDTYTSITIRDGDSCEFNAILKNNGNIVDNAKFNFNIDYNSNATNILGFKIDSDTECTVTNIKYPYVVYLECKYKDDDTIINRIKINLKALW